MKAEDLRAKSEDELKALLLEQRKAQFNMRFQRSGGQLEKTHEMRKARRTIARIKTFLNAPAEAVKAKPKAKVAAAKKAAPKAKAKTTAKTKDKTDAA